MMTVKEVSELTGVSIRALHHYDSIGLLKPARVTDAGYRLYDASSLSRLQGILLFRELRFSLKEIREILDSPDFDPMEAISQQIVLLEKQYRHIGKLLDYAREIQTKGVDNMSFEAFDNSELEQYRAEAKEKWGNTAAYKEYEERSKNKNTKNNAERLMAIFSEIGTLRNQPADSDEVQAKIAELQQYITDNYYTCTNEIFSGLGEMYAGDERFKQNIDSAGGSGTAEFVKQAIGVYCGK